MSSNSNRLLLSLACLPLASSAAHAAALPAPLSQHAATAWSFAHENVLGTSLDLTLRAANHLAAQHAESALLATLDHYDSILSAWRADSEFSRWAATHSLATAVSPELLHVLALFDHWRTETLNALNPAAQAAIQLWRNATLAGRTPTPAELRAAGAAMQQHHWQLDEAAGAATRLTSTPLVLASLTKTHIADRAANAALSSGATGIVLNLGGDIIVRGDIAQPIAIASPLAPDNGAPLDRVLLRDRAIATSGSYRRGFSTAGAPQPEYSHIIDPRTAQPANHIVSSTVIAHDPATAGALATAFSILTPAESHSLALKHNADYLLLTRGGEQLTSPNWSSYRAELRPASYPAPKPQHAAAPASPWAQGFELDINLEIARLGDFRYRRPYVAVWIENEQHVPVRAIALWYAKPRYLEELHVWDREFRMVGNTALNAAAAVSSATRSPGTYNLKWDGKDDSGKPVAPGKYTVCIEAAREHGGYNIIRQEMDFTTKPQQASVPAQGELGGVTLDYHKR